MPDSFVIAVASGKGGTGKTTIATNLARYVAHLGQKVQYLNCDCWRLCPADAIKAKPLKVGDIELGKAGDIDFVHGGLRAAYVRTPSVIKQVKRQIKENHPARINLTSCISGLKGGLLYDEKRRLRIRRKNNS